MEGRRRRSHPGPADDRCQSSGNTCHCSGNFVHLKTIEVIDLDQEVNVGCRASQIGVEKLDSSKPSLAIPCRKWGVILPVT